MFDKLKTSRGVSITVLIVTVILLLIIAGVSITVFTGSGLFDNAQEAVRQQKIAQSEEELSLALTEYMLHQRGKNITIDGFINYLVSEAKLITSEDIDTDEEGNKLITTDTGFVFEVITKSGLIEINPVGEAGELPPVIKITSTTHTTNSITVTVSTRRNTDGKIQYYIKKDSEGNFEKKAEITDTTYTFDGLYQNELYEIKVIAVAPNNQTAEVTKKEGTGSITNLDTELETPNVTFAHENVDGSTTGGWTNGNVTVTASTTVTGFTLKTSKTGTSWDNSTTQTFTENGLLYAVLTDGTNYGGAATDNVVNIDKIAPTASITSSNVTTNSFRLDVTTEDEDSGLSKIKWYYKKSDANNWTSIEHTYQALHSATAGTTSEVTKSNTDQSAITGLTSGTYSAYAEVWDVAGNMTTTNTLNNITLGTVTYAIGDIIPTTTWSNSGPTATVTLSKKSGVNSAYSIQYQIDSVSANGWIAYNTSTGITNVSSGQAVYARLTDGINASSTYMTENPRLSYTIAIDKNDGSAVTNVNATYGTAINITNPTREGYTFTGWTASNLSTGTAYYGDASNLTQTLWSSTSTIPTATWFKDLRNVNSTTVTLTANWETLFVARTMTVNINMANSNPSTWATYADDAVNMEAGSDEWDEFFGYYPCVLENGVELGKLNRNDYTKYEDGTSAPITTLGKDVMVCFPRLGYKLSVSGNILTVSMTNEDNKEGYCYLAHTYKGQKCDKFYSAAYLGYISNNQMYSCSGVIPTRDNYSMSQARTYARARGTGYEQNGFFEHTFKQCIYSLKYKAANCATTIGIGYTGHYKQQGSRACGVTNTKGMDYGSSNTEAVKLFGIEDFYGYYKYYADGFFVKTDSYIYVSDGDYNDTGANYTKTTATVGDNVGGNITRVYGNNLVGFSVAASGFSSSGSYNNYFSTYGRSYYRYAQTLAVGGPQAGQVEGGGVYYWFCNIFPTATNQPGTGRLSYKNLEQ